MSETKLMRIMTKNGWRAKLFGDKPATWKDRLRDGLIMLRSVGVHMQVQFTERYGHISFTSTLRHGANGCCFLDTKYSHPEYWDPVYMPVTAEQELQMWIKACRMAHVPDDIFEDHLTKRPSQYISKIFTHNSCYYGKHHVEYDFWRGAVFSYISKAKIIKPSKTKMVCNRAVTEVVLDGIPMVMDIVTTEDFDFKGIADFASMTPSEIDAMFRNYFRDKI